MAYRLPCALRDIRASRSRKLHVVAGDDNGLPGRNHESTKCELQQILFGPTASANEMV